MRIEPYIQQVADGKYNFYDECLAFAENWLKAQTSVFTSENLIADYNKTNHAAPKEPRVWGAVIKKLSKNKLITLVRYEAYKKSSGHGKPCAVWARTNAPVKSWVVPKIEVKIETPEKTEQITLF